MATNRQRDLEVFTEANQLPEEERMAFLDRVCVGDTDLRDRVTALLRSNERAGEFLESPPTASIGVVRDRVTVGEKPGDWIGRYKLLEQIGSGGCGIVFLTEQREPIYRRVALKIIKPGMDTRSVIARFEAERQAMAMMDHPNIAKILDAGATESGRPYFVMELVRGVKITEYCDKHSLTTDERLGLFTQVCQAVQHAHQKGIIHRDIKPSNILVAASVEGTPLPVVIDFGIAKATTNQPLTDKTLFTALEMLIGTPAYMSPEQAAFATVDVDTRTDIYSLGVLLYELLTGATPFDTEALLKAGLDEIRRVIREQEPLRPSTRLSKLLESDLTTVAHARQAEPSTLVRAVRGDLDWIVMKALEKDRTRRYATANGLALDVQRFLANEAVSARPPNAFYKLQKLARRNKLVFASLGVIATLVFASLVVVSIALTKEKKARRDALDEAARSRAATEFMNDMITSVDPVAANGRDAKTMLREMLDKAAERIGTKLTNQPIAQADMRLTIGKVYGNLALFDEEESAINAALATYSNAPGAEQKIVAARFALSEMQARKGRMALSEQETRKALTALKGQETMDSVMLEAQLGRAAIAEKRPEEGEALLRHALATGQRLSNNQDKRLLSITMLLTSALGSEGKTDEAEELARDCLRRTQASAGTNSFQTLDAMVFLATVLEKQKKLAEAENLSRQCVAIAHAIAPPDHPELEQSLWHLSRELLEEQNFTEAEDAYRELLAVRRKRYGSYDECVMDTAGTLVHILVPDCGEEKLNRLASEIPEARAVLAEDLAHHGRWQDARRAAARFLETRPGDPNGYHLLAPLLAQLGDLAAYDALCAEISRLFVGATDARVADRMAKDCLILPRPGADLTTTAGLADAAVTLGQGDPSLPYFQCRKALAEYRQGHWDAATNWAQRAVKNPNSFACAEAHAVWAMAQCRLKQMESSRQTLERCREIVQTQMHKAGDEDLGQDWRDWIIAHALLKEADQLIANSP